MKNLQKFGSFLNEAEDGDLKGFHANIEKDTIANTDYRKVLYTADGMQLALMSIQPGKDIGEEVHDVSDQFFRVDAGKGKCIIEDGTEYVLVNGDAIIVPKGAKHNIINTGEEDLKLYTIYAPPHHADGVIRKTKEDAEDPANAEEFDGKTTE